MRKIIIWLLGLCDHKWEERDHGRIIGRDGRPVGEFYNLRCTKCGNMKRKNLETD